AKKEIPSFSAGQVKLTIPEATQSGKVFRVKGEGFPNVHGSGKGDMLVRMNVETPTKLSDKQRELLTEFATLEQPANFPNKKSFFDKLKGLFS
ncbi:MAG TPA: DnaJ C-terminal domain-containing protein, partial [Chlamydiales bacterium]|nr:DnaJ C-terminal domain-containing protein [Chlamydiales bacterium]